MKRILLSALALNLTFGLYAQTATRGVVQMPNAGNVLAAPYIDPNNVPEFVGNVKSNPGPWKSYPVVFAGDSIDIGKSTYDLQTNASSIAHRAFKSGNTIGTAWTNSNANDASWADRGTAVNYSMDNGTSWGAIPTTRIESVRCGFGAMDKLGATGECVVSHVGAGPLKFLKRTVAGTGTWTETDMPGLTTNNFLWPAIATGGTNNNTVHVVALTTPTGNGGVAYLGMNGALLYSRSTDGGVTWDIQNIQLPGADSVNYIGISANNYSIDANGNNVAVVCGSLYTDWVLWKSTDNGNTWTKKIIYKFFKTRYDTSKDNTDIDGNGTTDTILSTDGSNAVVIGNDGVAHCFTGALFVWQDTAAGASLFLSLGTNGLFHWSENEAGNMDQTQLRNRATVAQAYDWDGDGIINTGTIGTGSRYGNMGLCSMPSAAVGPNNEIYLVYSAYRENTDDGLGHKFRGIYVKKSLDGGNVWTSNLLAFNVYNDDFSECIYPSIARDADANCVHVTFQWDDVVGTAANATPAAFNGNNYIKYRCVAPTEVATTVKNIPVANASVSVSVYPNPSSIGEASIRYSLPKESLVEVNITNVTGQQVFHKVENLNAGGALMQVNTSNFSKGVYYVNSTINGTLYTTKLVIE